MAEELGVVSTSLIRPVIYRLKRAGFSIQRLVEGSGLSICALETPTSFLPRQATQRFAHNVTRTTGDNLLFYDASSDGIDELVKMTPDRVLSRTLPVYERLKRCLNLASRGSSTVNLFPRVEGDLLWLVRASSEKREQENWCFEQYAIGALEAIARQILGPNVRPVSIRLRSTPRQDQMPIHWRESDVKMCQRQSSIAVPTSVLEKVASREDGLPIPEPTTANGGLNIADLASAVSVYATDSELGIDHVAFAFGMNRRTFQRRMAQFGMTYSELVEEVRFQQALQLMRSPEITVTEIAIQVGYSISENFTRAFRRRYGQPPSQFRRLLS